jgi:prevent-host-death family protein
LDYFNGPSVGPKGGDVEIAVSEAKAQLTELLRRAEAGEEVILPRHGRPAGRIVPLARPRLSPEQRRKIIQEVRNLAAGSLTGSDAAHNHDFLYDEHGLPK